MGITTASQANAYALRMFNDDFWDKKYTPHLDNLSRIKHPNGYQEYAYLLPVTMVVSRECVGEDDDLEYPDGIPDELADDDQGEITIDLVLCIDEPLAYDESKKDHVYADELLGIEISEYSCGKMLGDIELSGDATLHILNRIGQNYVCSDVFDSNQWLYLALKNKVLDMVEA